MSSNIPCKAPQVCNVKSHRPGTVTKCADLRPSASESGSSASKLYGPPVPQEKPGILSIVEFRDIQRGYTNDALADDRVTDLARRMNSRPEVDVVTSSEKELNSVLDELGIPSNDEMNKQLPMSARSIPFRKRLFARIRIRVSQDELWAQSEGTRFEGKIDSSEYREFEGEFFNDPIIQRAWKSVQFSPHAKREMGDAAVMRAMEVATDATAERLEELDVPGSASEYPTEYHLRRMIAIRTMQSQPLAK